MSEDTGTVAGESIADAEVQLSVMDHAREYDQNAPPDDAAPEGETTEEKAERLHHSANQKREKDTGKFDTGKVRHRAKSQQASPEDVPRIRELSGKVKTAEEGKRTSDERVAALEEEVKRLKANHAPASQIERAEKKADAADDPEPNAEDPKYAANGGVVKYIADQARWAAREAIRSQRQQDSDDAATSQKAARHQEASDAFTARVKVTAAKYADFEDVALKAPAKWLLKDDKGGMQAAPGAEALDAFIREDDNGPELLYYFQRNSAEVDALMELPVLSQLKTLALLSQRLASSSSEQAGNTGAVAGPKLRLPPKPPTPVRTEAQRDSKAPDSDGPLSVMQHAKLYKRR